MKPRAAGDVMCILACKKIACTRDLELVVCAGAMLSINATNSDHRLRGVANTIATRVPLLAFAIARSI